MKVFKSSEGGGNPYHQPRISQADAAPTPTGISDVWTAIALWWLMDKALHRLNGTKALQAPRLLSLAQ